MKRFMVPTTFGSFTTPFPIYVGEALPGVHPLAGQASWLRHDRGGVMELEVVTSFRKLAKIAVDNRLSFQALAMYAMSDDPDGTEPPDDRPAGEADLEVWIPVVLPDGSTRPMLFQVGWVLPGQHPLAAQAAQIWRETRAMVPPEVMDRFAHLASLAVERGEHLPTLVAQEVDEHGVLRPPSAPPPEAGPPASTAVPTEDEEETYWFSSPVILPDGSRGAATLTVGPAVPGEHPLAAQAEWLRQERGATVPQEVMDSLEKLHRIALDNGVSLPALTRYAMQTAMSDDDEEAG